VHQLQEEDSDCMEGANCFEEAYADVVMITQKVFICKSHLEEIDTEEKPAVYDSRFSHTD